METLQRSETRIYLSQENKWTRNEACIQRVGTVRAHSLPGGFFGFAEVTLLAGQSWDKPAAQSGINICIPLLGSILLGEGKFMEPGELYQFFTPMGKSITVENPHQQDSIHLLWINLPCPNATSSQLIDFQLEEDLRHIAQIEILGTCTNLNLYLGRILGRNEASIRTHGPSFGFVLSGAFEYQNCLLEHGDGLWIEEGAGVEMEALSMEGLIMVLEFEE